MHNFKQLLSDLENSTKIAIISHTNMDVDSICSSLALKKLIIQKLSNENNPITVDIFSDTDEVSELCKPIIKSEIINPDEQNNYDFVITLDSPTVFRLGKYAEIFNKAPKTANLDHHETNEEFADNNLVVKISSTCELIYALFIHAQKMPLTDEVAKLLYAGIITDTNNLTQGKISVRTHKIIAELMSKNINYEALREFFFKNNTKNKAFLLQKALSSLRFFSNDRIAFMQLTKSDFIETDSTFDDTLGIVNHGIDLKGVDIAVLFIKQEDNSYYISLRSKNGVNVGNIASQLGGGGHETVAAFQYSGYLTDIKEALLKACNQELANHPQTDFPDNLFGDEQAQ